MVSRTERQQKALAVLFDRFLGILLGETQVQAFSTVALAQSRTPGAESMHKPAKLFKAGGLKHLDPGRSCHDCHNCQNRQNLQMYSWTALKNGTADICCRKGWGRKDHSFLRLCPESDGPQTARLRAAYVNRSGPRAGRRPPGAIEIHSQTPLSC